ITRRAPATNPAKSGWTPAASRASDIRSRNASTRASLPPSALATASPCTFGGSAAARERRRRRGRAAAVRMAWRRGGAANCGASRASSIRRARPRERTSPGRTATLPHAMRVDATTAIEAEVERFAPGFRGRILVARDAPDARIANASLRGLPLRRPAPGPRSARGRLLRPAAVVAEASSQRVHEVDDLPAALGRARALSHGDRLLLRDQLLESLAVRVRVLRRIPLAGHLIDERDRHLALVVADLRVLDLDLARLSKLGRHPDHLERHEVLARHEGREERPRPHVEARDPDLPRREERVLQQAVGLRAALLRGDVVRLLEQQRVDRGELHELHDLDRAIALPDLLLHLVQLLLLDDRVLALADLVALHDLVVRDLYLLLAADLLVPDRRHVLPVKHPEVDALPGFERRVQRDRDRNETEGEMSAPDGSSHVVPPAARTVPSGPRGCVHRPGYRCRGTRKTLKNGQATGSFFRRRPRRGRTRATRRSRPRAGSSSCRRAGGGPPRTRRRAARRARSSARARRAARARASPRRARRS